MTPSYLNDTYII